MHRYLIGKWVSMCLHAATFLVSLLSTFLTVQTGLFLVVSGERLFLLFDISTHIIPFSSVHFITLVGIFLIAASEIIWLIDYFSLSKMLKGANLGQSKQV